MVPSAARVACIARAACTSLYQNSNKETFRNRVVPWVGFKDSIYTRYILKKTSTSTYE